MGFTLGNSGDDDDTQPNYLSNTPGAVTQVGPARPFQHSLRPPAFKNPPARRHYAPQPNRQPQPRRAQRPQQGQSTRPAPSMAPPVFGPASPGATPQFGSPSPRYQGGNPYDFGSVDQAFMPPAAPDIQQLRRPSLTDDMKAFGQYPKRALIGNSDNKITAATFIDPSSGRTGTLFYGGDADGGMYGRRLDDTDPRVQAALQSNPMLARGAMPARVQQTAANNGGVHNVAPFDPNTGTYRVRYKNGLVQSYDANFNPVNTGDVTYQRSGAGQLNSLTPGDYFMAALGDRANDVIQQGHDASTWAGDKAEKGMLGYFQSLHDTPGGNISYPNGINGPAVHLPSDPPTSSEKWMAKLVGNAVRGAGNMVASAPDAALVTGDLIGTGVKTDLDGLLQFGAVARGDRAGEAYWDRTRNADLGDTEKKFDDMAMATVGGENGAGMTAIEGVVARNQGKRQLSNQLFQKAATKGLKEAYDDPVQAYFTLEGLRGAWRAADAAVAKSALDAIERRRVQLGSIVDTATKNGQLGLANSVRSQIGMLTNTQGKLNQLFQAAKARGIVADASDAVANPAREGYGQSAAGPGKPTQLSVEPPVPAPLKPPLARGQESPPQRYTAKIPSEQNTTSFNPEASAKAGASDIWDKRWLYDWDPYGYGARRSQGGSSILARPTPVSWRDVTGIGQDSTPNEVRTDEPVSSSQDGSRPNIQDLRSILSYTQGPDEALQAMTKARQAISAIHDVLGLPPITVRGTRRAAIGNRGQYVDGILDDDDNMVPAPIRKRNISLAADGPWPIISFVHEFGHALDNLGWLPRHVYSSVRSPEFAGWRKAVESTDAIKALRKADQTGYLDFRHPDGTSEEIYPGSKRIQYLLQPEEMFARSYAQWIATKAARLGHSEIAEQLGNMLNHYETTVGRAQWSTDDFARVEEAIDSLFDRRGWLKK